MSGYPDEGLSLEKEKARFNYRLQLTILILLNILTALTVSFSFYGGARRLQFYLLGNGSLLLGTAALILVYRHSADRRFRDWLFFLILLFYALIQQILTREYGIILTGLFFSVFLVVIYTGHNLIQLRLFSFLYLLLLIYSVLSAPVLTVTLSWGFYLGAFSCLLISFLVSSRGISLYRKQEKMLRRKIGTASRQLEEISALNIKSRKVLERLEAVLDVSEDGIIDIDTGSGRIVMSPRSREILGFRTDFLREMEERFALHLDREDEPLLREVWEDLKALRLTEDMREVFYNLPDSRKRIRFNVLCFSSKEDGSIHQIMMVKDVTREYDQSRRIYDSAYKDGLTGLMNRQALVNFIEENREGYFVSCVAIMDIDNFRFFNDSFGYETGDRILRKVAALLEEKKESYIKAVSCLGGNNFALYMDTVVDEHQFFKRLQRELQSFALDDLEIRLNFSIGIAYISDADSSSDGLIKKAEIAMYKAKERGKNGVCVYSDDLKQEMQRHLEIMNELEAAIIKREFYLNYQPKVDPVSRRVIGFEALVRWNSSRLGFIPPDEFIRLAEQSGLINALGEFIIEESCRFLQRLMSLYGEQEDFRVSINVSAVQLLNSGFYESFFRILDDMDIPSRMVGIEITETAVMENKDFVIEQLIRFREKGILVYLDDFGTGYSSLNYLTMLPIDVMKVDKSFVDPIVQEGREHQVVKMILSLAETFSLVSVAEGVEDEDQLKALLDMGCRIFQGYYFSKPLAENEALAFVSSFTQEKA